MNTEINAPELWLPRFPRPRDDDNKYDRGHAVIYGATELTGATRLAASACSKIGAGLVTVLATQKADIYRMTLPADIMVRECKIGDLRHVSAILAGPGENGKSEHGDVLNLAKNIPCVFDASAIPQQHDFALLNENCVLTPHLGEFQRAFPKLTGDSVVLARGAAALSGACIVLKGAQTVIAAPNGEIVTNTHASPYLAKAGTGDVLAGLITGLIAQGMSAFDASCAAVWIHGEASLRIGPGLVASVLPDMIPNVLHDLVD